MIFGAEAGTDLSAAYGFRAAAARTIVGERAAPSSTRHLPKLTEDSFPGVLANVIAGRIANRLDLGGENYTVDAACASSLAALDVACKRAASGASDMVLCGGADLHNGIHDYLLFASVHALSPTGRCRTFDAAADGIALGEGVACVVLKRLADAERDGDRIYAVIKAVAASSDGRSLGLTAPRQEGQARALDRAYDRSGVSPADGRPGRGPRHRHGRRRPHRAGHAHRACSPSAARRRARCVLGSVKSQIGHTKCAAGLAGLIKAAKAVHHGVLPPTLHVDEPNPAWDAETSPFVFLDAGPARGSASERRAGVSAFGFGGTNFHAVLSAYDGGDEPGRTASTQWPAELFALPRRAPADAVAEARPPRRPARGRRRRRRGRWRLPRPGRAPCRAPAPGAGAGGDRGRRPRRPGRQGGPRPGRPRRPPRRVRRRRRRSRPDGEPDGSRRPRSPSCSPARAASGRACSPTCSWPSRALRRCSRSATAWAAERMFPPAAFGDGGRDSPAAALTDTRVAQPALGLAGLAMTELLGRSACGPTLPAGHSYGELVALCAAGALRRRRPAGAQRGAGRGHPRRRRPATTPGRWPRSRGRSTRSAARSTPGPTSSWPTTTRPTQIVIAGPTGGGRRGRGAARRAGYGQAAAGGLRLPQPGVGRPPTPLAAHLGDVEVAAPRFPVWSNTTAAPYAGDAGEVRALLAGQVASAGALRRAGRGHVRGRRPGVRRGGPGRVLTRLVGKILGDRPHTAVATDAAGDHGVRRFLLALAELAAAGVAVDVAALFDGRDARAVDAAAVPARAPYLLNGSQVRTADGERVPGSLPPAHEFLPIALAAGSGAAPVAAGDRRCRGRVPARHAADRGGRARRGLGRTGGAAVVVGSRGAGTGHRRLVGAVVGHRGRRPGQRSRHRQRPQQRPRQRQRVVRAQRRRQRWRDRPCGPRRRRPGTRRRASRITPEALLDTVVAIVSERTGYPVEMLDPDLDLEAELSIDSIKRIEILGELAERVGLPGMDESGVDESVVEELALIKTLRGIVDWIEEHRDDEALVAAATGPRPVAVAASLAAPAASPVLTSDALLDTIVAIVSERTGYPVEMLDPDLDLEAELSIDSIKRIEILGELAERVGLPGMDESGVDESVVEELALIKTLRGIVDWVDDHEDLAPGAGTAGDGSAGDIGAADGRVGSARPRRPPPRRRPGPGVWGTRPARRRRRSSATCRRWSTCPRSTRPATWRARPWWWSTPVRRWVNACTTSSRRPGRPRSAWAPPRPLVPWRRGSTRSST